MLSRFLVPIAIAVVYQVAWASSYAEANLSSQVLLVATLSGSKVVPAVQTQARGLVAVLLNFQKDSAFVTGTLTGTTSAITGIHLHRGREGENGDVVLDLTSSLNGNIVASATRLSNLPSALVAAALNGELYVAVHTMTNPGGELRGQLQAETDVQLSAMLSGAQQVPPVMTDARGMVIATVRQDGKKLRIWAVFEGTAQVTAAHLHRGSPGQNGEVVADLSSMIAGNAIVGEVESSSFVQDLLAGEIYLNIHTTAHPNGELRGQLVATATSQLAFETWLDGTQQVPTVSTMARGVGRFWLNASLDTLYWNIVVTGLSSTVTGVHLHRGKPGVSGDVLLDLSASVQSNGTISGSAANPSRTLVEALLQGDVYINVHTQNYPQGEIRGQVWRLVREGFVVSLDGTQQVPPVITTARGTGIVSIDRSGSSVHFEFVINGTTTDAVHFHKGKRGENGDVLFDLTGYFNAVAMVGAYASGYWTTESMPALDDEAVELFFRDSVYVNVHTMLHPNGECRGQVTRQYAPMGVSSIDDDVSGQNATVYPNPATTQLWIEVGTTDGSAVEWTVYTLRGETVLRGTSQTRGGKITIEVDNLPQGFYIVRCGSPEGRVRSVAFLKQ